MLDPVAGVLTTPVVNLILGMFLDPIGNMLNTLSLDLALFDIIVANSIEIGMLTLPFGFHVSVI